MFKYASQAKLLKEDFSCSRSNVNLNKINIATGTHTNKNCQTQKGLTLDQRPSN